MKNIIKVISFIILISGFAHADIVEKLKSLNNLYKEGAITKEEFTKAKSILLQNKDKEENKKKIEKVKKKKIETKKKNKIVKKIEKKKNEDLGDFDPFGDFFIIFGASRLCLKIDEVPIRYKARIYGETQISRFSHGLLLIKKLLFAFFKIKAI